MLRLAQKNEAMVVIIFRVIRFDYYVLFTIYQQPIYDKLLQIDILEASIQ